MKHYDYIEWMFYKNGMLTEAKSEEMEQHLYNCDTCMEIFLSLIDEKEENTVEQFIPDDFTSKIINNVPKLKNNKMKNKQAKRVFYYQFGYYAAVASVTVILTLGGLYVDLVDAVPKISVFTQKTEKHSNGIADFSDSIVNSTSDFLFSIENIDLNIGGKSNER